MESANVDLTRRFIAAFNARHVDGLIAYSDPSVELHSSFEVVGGGIYHGHWKGLAGMAEANRNFLDAWADLRQEAEEYRELDDERVLVLHRFVGRGKRSGLSVAQMQGAGAAMFQIRDGKVTGLVHYFDPVRALADLGLAPEAG